MAQLSGFMVDSTDKAIAFVYAADAASAAIRPFWIPRSKVESLAEKDTRSVEIMTAQLGLRVGIPVDVGIDDSFAAKIAAAKKAE